MPRLRDVYPCVVCPLVNASRLIALVVCLLLSFTFVNSAYGQGATATLSGVVTDQTGAVIPGAGIAVISIAQGFQRTSATNDEGIFVVPLLPPGNYTVKAEHDGFNPAEFRDVILNVNDQRTIKISLKVGSVANQSVDVLDSPALIDESPAVGTTVDRQFVSNLPLNGRSFQSLIALSPFCTSVKSKASSGHWRGSNGAFRESARPGVITSYADRRPDGTLTRVETRLSPLALDRDPESPYNSKASGCLTWPTAVDMRS